MKYLLTIQSTDNLFCINYFCREDGTYGYIELKNVSTPEAPVWQKYANPSSRFISLEVAKLEAESRVTWLRKETEWVARDNESMSALEYIENWIKCPFCSIRFSLLDRHRWGGGRHLTCGQKISVQPMHH
jgi:hypothetical protein